VTIIAAFIPEAPIDRFGCSTSTYRFQRTKQPEMRFRALLGKGNADRLELSKGR
jgi:hypothetical protein